MPCSNYRYQMMLWEQRKTSIRDNQVDGVNSELRDNEYRMKFEKRTAKRGFTRDITKRVNKLMEEYDLNIDIKRERLRDLLYKEEQEYYREVIDQAQRGGDSWLDDKRARIAELKAKREEERQKLAHEKRIQQYVNKSEPLRPLVSQKNTLETKKVQLLQIKENEMKRESERELNNMWNELMMKESKAKAEREEQDEIRRKMYTKEMFDSIRLQMKGIELAKREKERIDKEDREDMGKFMALIRQEEIDGLDEKRRKRDELKRELFNQIKQKEEFVANRERIEREAVNTYHHLATEILRKEQQEKSDAVTRANREMLQYREHVKRMERERKEEEKRLEKLLEEQRNYLEDCQSEARRKIHAAKDMLLKETKMLLDEQVKYKQQIAEEQRKMKETENELMRMSVAQDQRLEAEYLRTQIEARIKYRNDLTKQIEYNKVLKQREQQEEDRAFKASLEEETKYVELVHSLRDKAFEVGGIHPFTKIYKELENKCPQE